ncbi:hypothetical protein HDF16_002696 [Granulicella aggregans]|uniref:Glycosyl hydrolase family 79 n=1 Tax=Granulicella aggregans TaxID=474949 RepID=A0A7W7ZDQ0_9BACT|nr:glycosyl hydrolase family 79 C-terminal domain-containing protein [Granulicella aggregans]MBB5057990.1 hypothetical protein [Granulicella aggregans]
MTTRRSLLRSALASSALIALKCNRLAIAEPVSATSGRPLARIPSDFIGLGYEMSSVGRADLLTGKNAAYVHLLSNLGPKGVLRIGGIVADFTSYSPHGPGSAQPRDTVITRDSLIQLRTLLDATGWTAIWSLNFGSGTLNDAVAEAKVVQQILGSRLNAIELGNEVENYSRGEHPLRTPPYLYDNYRAEYSRWRAAILAAVPTLCFAAPDTAASVEWVEKMAADSRGDVQLLTTHYYRGDQRHGTQDQLLQTDLELIDRLKRLREASKKSGIPWRMCETNSFFGGGRPGVSDTLAGALWTLEFTLLLAACGCAGVNIETGVNQLGFVSSYSPIQDDGAGHNSAGAPYYGMLAFATAVAESREVLAMSHATSDRELSSFTLGRAGRLHSVVLINKSATASLPFSLSELNLRKLTVLYLRGPSPESTTGITFGGAAVDPQGRWTGWPIPLSAESVIIQPASAVVIQAS